MTNIPPPDGLIASDTRSLYLHLLNLKQEDGAPATDSVRLHRQIAEASGMPTANLDTAALARYLAGDQEIDAQHLGALRAALDRAHREVVDSRFTWKPRWLNARQGIRHAHPSLASQARPHHSRGALTAEGEGKSLVSQFPPNASIKPTASANRS